MTKTGHVSGMCSSGAKQSWSPTRRNSNARFSACEQSIRSMTSTCSPTTLPSYASLRCGSPPGGRFRQLLCLGSRTQTSSVRRTHKRVNTLNRHHSTELFQQCQPAIERLTPPGKCWIKENLLCTDLG